MSLLTTAGLVEIFVRLAQRMKDERDELCRLDGIIGDADHGIAMEQGTAAAAAAVAALPDTATLADQFNAAAKGFLNAVGASSGPLYATAFMSAAKMAGPRGAMPATETPTLIKAMADGIARRGKAVPGQKTMIDAWDPAARMAETFSEQAETSLAAGLAAMVEAAKAGADGTARMVATLGRAARLGDRSLGHPDPGAVSATMMIAVFCEGFAKAENAG
jgi:dihydroxyacetone kinase-like protein